MQRRFAWVPRCTGSFEAEAIRQNLRKTSFWTGSSYCARAAELQNESALAVLAKTCSNILWPQSPHAPSNGPHRKVNLLTTCHFVCNLLLSGFFICTSSIEGLLPLHKLCGSLDQCVDQIDFTLADAV